MSDIRCPYCGEKNTIDGDNLPWVEDEQDEYTCLHCDKKYLLQCHVNVWHEATTLEENEKWE